MAAGGMTRTNLGEYVTAGARVVTMLGNGLDAGDYAAITRAAREWVEAVRRPEQIALIWDSRAVRARAERGNERALLDFPDFRG